MRFLHLLLFQSFGITAFSISLAANGVTDTTIQSNPSLDCLTAISAIPGTVAGTRQMEQSVSLHARLWKTPTWITHGACNILIRSVEPEMNEKTPVYLKRLFWNEVKARAWTLYWEDVSQGLPGYDLKPMSFMPPQHMYSLVILLNEPDVPFDPPHLHTNSLMWDHYAAL